MESQITAAVGFDRVITKGKQIDIAVLEEMEADPKYSAMRHLISELRMTLRNQEMSLPASPEEISWNCVDALRTFTRNSDRECMIMLR